MNELKTKKGMIIGGAAIAAAAVVGIGVFAVASKDPKTVVTDAFKGVYAADRVNPSEEMFGLGQLFEQFETTGGEMGLEFTYTGANDEILDMLTGSGITVKAASDVVNRKFSEQIGILYSGMELGNLTIYGDENDLMAALPDLTTKVLTIHYAEDLSEQIANSPLMAMSGYEIGEEEKQAIDNYVSYLTSIYSGEKKPFDLKGLWQRYKEGSQAMESFKEALTVTKADSAQLLYNGSEQKCTGYDVVVPKAALIEFLKTTSSFFLEDESLKNDVMEYVMALSVMDEISFDAADWEELGTACDQAIAQLDQILDGDITMRVYITKKGQLATMDASCKFTEEETTLDMNVKATLEGGSYPTQNGTLTITTTDGTDTIVAGLTKNGEYTDASYHSRLDGQIEYGGETMGIGYENTYDRTTGDSVVQITLGGSEGLGINETEITINGVVDELEKGKKIHYTMDSLVVKEPASGVFYEVSGAFYVGELQSEIAAPKGEEMDVLAASEEDWEELLNEIMMNLYSLILGGGLSE